MVRRLVVVVAVVMVVLATAGCASPPAAGTGAGSEGTERVAAVREAGAASWTGARPGYGWSFPADHSAHPGYRTEWWYFVGHLEAEQEPDRRFGYQFTFFRIGVLPELPAADSAWSASDLVMGHAAVSDLSGGEHRFSEVLYRAVPLLGGFPAPPEPLIAWSRGPAGTEERWTLRWNGEGFDLAMADAAQQMSLSLSVRPARPLIFQGPNGYSRKGRGPTAASQYYSMTRLVTEGSVTLDGRVFRVRGTSWMDREFGSNQLDEHQVGWDWFSLQLDDGRDLMLYRLRNDAGETDFSRATLLPAAGEPIYLDGDEWSLETTATWTSSETGAAYPSAWTLEIPTHGIRLAIAPELADQENRGRIVYWEGAVRVLGGDGEPAGRGYVELTGYGTRNRPAI
jgi:predicted secreted hydrolase